MGKSNQYRPPWHPPPPRPHAAVACESAQGVPSIDRTLSARLPLRLAPLFALSHSSHGTLKKMAAYGKRARGAFSFTVFRDDDDDDGRDGRDAHGDAQNSARLQKRQRREQCPSKAAQKTAALPKLSTLAPPQPCAIPSSPDELSRPLVTPVLSQPPHGLAFRSAPTEADRPGGTAGPRPSPHLSPVSETASDRNSVPWSTTAQPPSRPGSPDELGSALLEPRVYYRHPTTLSELVARRPSPNLRRVDTLVCQGSSPDLHRAARRRPQASSDSLDELSLQTPCASGRLAANGSQNTIAEQQSLSTNNTSLRRLASGLTDSTAAEELTAIPRLPFNLKKRHTLRNLRKMRAKDTPDGAAASSKDASPVKNVREHSAANLFSRAASALAEKTTNLKLSFPYFGNTQSQGAEKFTIGAPYNVRKGADAMTVQPRPPKPGEAERDWGNVEIQRKMQIDAYIKNNEVQMLENERPKNKDQPRGSMDIENLPRENVQTGTHKAPSRNASPSLNALREQKIHSANVSPSLTALPRPTTGMGLKNWVPPSSKFSKNKTNTGDTDSTADSFDPAQSTSNYSSSSQVSVLQKMKNSILSRRHKRSNTAGGHQSALEIRPNTSFFGDGLGFSTKGSRTSKSAANLMDPATDNRIDGPSGAHEQAPKPYRPPISLPHIDAGGPMSFSNMNLMERIEGISSDYSRVKTPSLANTPSLVNTPSRANTPRISEKGEHVIDSDAPAFARDPRIPSDMDISGHNGNYNIHPLRAHGEVTEFFEAPAQRKSTVPGT